MLFAQQQKHALVIGNANYTGISKLTNPVNDANDMEAALKGLGFTVDKVLNGNIEQMENAVLNLKRRLGASRNSYGFFFYAGHGVQSNGENYLIPVAADNIRSETQLRDRAVSLQFVLDTMSEAGNELNMIVLDACRDNPFGWARSGSRGLTVVSRAPTGSIVMYATGANSTAADGTGRNGLFTGYLLNNLKTPGLSVFDVFDRTMDAVIKGTNGSQNPELSLRFPGATSAFLGPRPSPSPAPQPAPTPAPSPAPQPSPASAPQPSPNPTPNQNYKIGDRGPAGGIVFYDKRNNSDGWRYMEVSPVDLQKAQWGLYGQDVVGTKRDIGSGKRNTELIIAALNRNGENGKAAQLCRAYTLNGYNDWFLPSEDELSEMLSLKRNNTINMGAFNSEWYWSSRQDYGGNSIKYAWIMSSTKPSGYQGSKSATGGVRAVRYF